MTKSEKPTKSDRNIWFPAKKYGYGWGRPVVWQGWVAFIGCLFVGLAPLLYLATFYKGDVYCREVITKGINAACNPEVATPVYMLGALLWFAAWILILVQVCTSKGEKASWRWGNKKGKNHSAAKPKSN